MNVSREIISRLRSKGLIRECTVIPDYSEFCITNIAPTVAQFLGINLESGIPLQKTDVIRQALGENGFFRQYEHVILLFIDSFNDTLMNHLISQSFSGKRSVEGMLTSTFPSVTPTCLASMLTGMPPISHGVVGFNLLIDGWIYSVFDLTSPLDDRKLPAERVREIFDLPDIFAASRASGIEARMIVPHALAEEGTRRIIDGELLIEGYRSFKEMVSIMEDNKAGFTYAYISTFDELLHELGIGAPMISNELLCLTDALRSLHIENTLLFLVSDHYHLELDQDNVIDLDDERLTSDLIHPPAISGGRMAYIYTSNPDRAVAFLEDKYDERVIILRSEDAVRCGIFGRGEMADDFCERIGEITLIAKDRGWIDYPYKKRQRHKASHGGLRREEMLVPFAFIEL
ncbi:MAG: hypothetical protein CW694_05410 [Candidatus Syntrophoarchaeum sp. WYZ-LMO15]|nr:MAG: hypothetical protein CW694_05410 [Candidatus Syntrophoarchaeum sp. WYZ-LMO15]